MRKLLFLCHRIPYPPDKGDKIRAWHVLSHLAQDWEVDLGCLVDDPADMQHVPFLREVCHSVGAFPTGSRLWSSVRAMRRLRPGQPLTVGWFHDAALQDWVDQNQRTRSYDAVYAFSAAMVPYLTSRQSFGSDPISILDMVDVDSEKWSEYARTSRFPMRLVWAREGRTLLSFERHAASLFHHCLFVSEQERERFAALAPEAAARADWVENGVDLGYFSPDRLYDNPFPADAASVVFTGTMDYRPNVEAVVWFAREVMPLLRQRLKKPFTFQIVGAKPAPQVRELGHLPGVNVTGAVPDIRPYLAHAQVAVAPLRIARGIQNKVLEAMAMGRPVVASPAAFEGVRAQPGADLLLADSPLRTAELVAEVIAGGWGHLGPSARRTMLANYEWSATLARLDAMLGKPLPAGTATLGAVA